MLHLLTVMISNIEVSLKNLTKKCSSYNCRETKAQTTTVMDERNKVAEISGQMSAKWPNSSGKLRCLEPPRTKFDLTVNDKLKI